MRFKVCENVDLLKYGFVKPDELCKKYNSPFMDNVAYYYSEFDNSIMLEVDTDGIIDIVVYQCDEQKQYTNEVLHIIWNLIESGEIEIIK